MQHEWGEEECTFISVKAGRKEHTRKTNAVDGWTILRWILERYDGVVWTGLF
jgi:hypothetical protein